MVVTKSKFSPASASFLQMPKAVLVTTRKSVPLCCSSLSSGMDETPKPMTQTSQSIATLANPYVACQLALRVSVDSQNYMRVGKCWTGKKNASKQIGHDDALQTTTVFPDKINLIRILGCDMCKASLVSVYTSTDAKHGKKKQFSAWKERFRRAGIRWLRLQCVFALF